MKLKSLLITLLPTVVFSSVFILSPLSLEYGQAKKDTDMQKRKEMIIMARQLGVTCTYCHDTKNLKSTKLKTHKISLNHIELVRGLNKIGIKSNKKRSKVKADCFMCHRGKAIPDYVEIVPSELEGE